MTTTKDGALPTTILNPTAGDFRRLMGSRVGFVHRDRFKAGTIDNVVKGNVVIEGEVFVQKDVVEIRLDVIACDFCADVLDDLRQTTATKVGDKLKCAACVARETKPDDLKDTGT